jgi:predicted nucleic acid-binding protein
MAVSRAAITGVVRFELLEGARGEAEFARLEAALEGLPGIPMEEECWSEAARLSFLLRRAGLTIPPPDLMIAAAALQADVAVLHRDRHFDAIAAHTSLRVESYV